MNYFEKIKNDYNSKLQELNKLGEDIKQLSVKFVNQNIVDKLIKENLSTDLYIKGDSGFGHIIYDEPQNNIYLGHISKPTFKYYSCALQRIEKIEQFRSPIPTQSKCLTDFEIGVENTHLFYCVNPVNRQYPWHSECEFIEVGKFYHVFLSKHSYSGSWQISFKEFCNDNYITYSITDPSLINDSFITIEDYKKLEKFKFNSGGFKEIKDVTKIATDEILTFQKIKNPQVNYIVNIEYGSVKDKETCKQIFINHAEPLKRSDYNLEMVQHYATGRNKTSRLNKNDFLFKFKDYSKSTIDWEQEEYKEGNKIGISLWKGGVMVDDHISNVIPNVSKLLIEDSVEGYSTYRGDKSIEDLMTLFTKSGFATEIE